MKIQYEVMLELFLWGLETFSRRDCGLILAGFRRTENDARLDRLLDRLREEGLVQRNGRGVSAKFTITAEGRKRVKVSDPSRAWDRSWDGHWRVFSFDLPSGRKRDRMALWRALRDRKLGLLQRSVWIWPHDVEFVLLEIVKAQGIPECFCGFESRRLFLCTDAEVVEASWDFEEIGRRHGTYLKHGVANQDTLRRARDLRELAHIARVERDAYQFAFSLDPLLPRTLWPKSYKGAVVEKRRQEFRACMRRRLCALVG